MGELIKPVVTQLGQALMAKIMAGVGNVKFTKIRTSSQIYMLSQLDGLTALDGIQQETLVSGVVRTKENEVKIYGAVNNLSLVTGYNCHTVGIYANDPDIGEILYQVTIATSADYIPAFNGITQSGINFSFNTKVGNSENINLKVDPAAVATGQQVQDAMAQVYTLDIRISALEANTLICNIPIKPDEILKFYKWTLYDNAGGIRGPLRNWRVGNSIPFELPTKAVFDLNTKTVSLYSISAYEGEIFNVADYSEGVFVLSSATKSLLLVRR